MLREVKTLHGATIHATDGEIGTVDEILFDDEHWTVRYLIVKTGGWLSGRKVLISPMAFGSLDWDQETLYVNLTREQVKNSPGVETDKPVSRQWERQYFDYYSWPYYWGAMSGWGAYWYPGELYAQPGVNPEPPQMNTDGPLLGHADAHLRSTKEVTGYGIAATDGHLGHVADFIVNDETWRICYLAIDTKDWWPGKHVLLPPDWISTVNWPSMSVTVNVTRDQVQNAPAWEAGQPISRIFEDQLYGYYSRQRPEDHERAIAPLRVPLVQSTEQSAVVAVYDTHAEAESAVRDLEHRGFDMTKLSIVGKDYEINEEVVGYYNTGERMKSWGATGAFWGGMWTLLFGSAFFLVPGVGPILAAGPIVGWIVGVLEGAAIGGGLSALGAALYSIGIPQDSILAYETQIKAGKFVVIAHDTPGTLDKARIALEGTTYKGVAQHEIHVLSATHS